MRRYSRETGASNRAVSYVQTRAVCVRGSDHRENLCALHCHILEGADYQC